VNEFWIERWQAGRTGWHEPAGSASLRKHWRGKGRRVLVPLCGKSLDLVWLADQGNEVIGVELSALAIRAFFAEQNLEFTVADDELPAYQALDKPITILCGDYFELTSLRCDAHYDRGALVALPAKLRARYAAQTNALLELPAERLVITLEYDQNIVDGPPYSVSADELLGYWPELQSVDAYEDLANGPPHFRDAGLTTMVEKIWRTP